MYNILLSEHAKRDLKSIKNISERKRIIKKLEDLKKFPNLPFKRLKGSDAYRVRVGDYMIIFYIENSNIIVLRIKTRSIVYKRFFNR